MLHGEDPGRGQHATTGLARLRRVIMAGPAVGYREGEQIIAPLTETVYAITSLTSAHATAPDLARLVREHCTIEAHHHIRDVTFGEDTAASRTGRGPANLATIRAAITAATDADIHGTRRSPVAGSRRRRSS